jgi:hypothetical protein
MNKTIKNVKLMAEVEISPMTIVDDFSREEALDFICAIDLAHADVGFTEELIIRLISSIRSDLVFSNEWDDFKTSINSVMV